MLRFCKDGDETLMVGFIEDRAKGIWRPVGEICVPVEAVDNIATTDSTDHTTRRQDDTYFNKMLRLSRKHSTTLYNSTSFSPASPTTYIITSDSILKTTIFPS